MRYENPRVYFLFYNYFLRAVIGEAKWKTRIKERKKLGQNIAEAYAHSLIENNYFAWLFEYKLETDGKQSNHDRVRRKHGDRRR